MEDGAKKTDHPIIKIAHHQHINISTYQHILYIMMSIPDCVLRIALVGSLFLNLLLVFENYSNNAVVSSLSSFSSSGGDSGVVRKAAGLHDEIHVSTHNNSDGVATRSASTAATNKNDTRLPYSFSEQNDMPIQVYPLLKELRAGWGNMESPGLLKRKVLASQHLLVVNIGLDQGEEFFTAMDNGFEVVGMEPNPISFGRLQAKCGTYPKCKAIVDISTISLPLQREPGVSYLLRAAAGETEQSLPFHAEGPLLMPPPPNPFLVMAEW
jgi:hypothetical protein